MNLKDYQQSVIDDLSTYIDYLNSTKNIPKAYHDFWEDKGIEVSKDSYVKPYQNEVARVPKITIKVPTAGGKTFIACNALRTIYESGLFPSSMAKVVVWLVPSDVILKQTFDNLNNPNHPYRQKIDLHFNKRVELFDKDRLLQGAGFQPSTVKESLNILVLSVQSFASNNKEGRKAFQDNGKLLSFEGVNAQSQTNIEGADDLSLIQIINGYQPVIIVDESHNVESNLRTEMLQNFNPSFILELTATPRLKSNIISFVDALKLKQNNMVKLPIIVSNQRRDADVIGAAKVLQRNLEEKAKAEEKAGGKYIRPIVLFQAQPKTDDDNLTFERVKKRLIETGIPENQIKIKTSKLDDLKGIDLLSPSCEVRFIITVNALKEGWDCPFAYILASLANKSSKVDVEQIIGRILRQPYAQKHQEDLLNCSYVLTASDNFIATLDKIVLGLNKSGFSTKEFRDNDENPETPKAPQGLQLVIPVDLVDDRIIGKSTNEETYKSENGEDSKFEDKENSKNENKEPISNENSTNNTDSSFRNESENQGKKQQKSNNQPLTEDIKTQTSDDPTNIVVEDVVDYEESIQAQKDFEDLAKKAEIENKKLEILVNTIANLSDNLPPETKLNMKGFRVIQEYQDEASKILIPQFFIKIPKNPVLGNTDEILLTEKALLLGFELNKQDRNIDFGDGNEEINIIDLSENTSEHLPEYGNKKFDKYAKEAFVKYISDLAPERQKGRMTDTILRLMGKMDELSDKSIKRYIQEVLEDLEDQGRFTEVLENESFFASRIKEKINSLTKRYAREQFKLRLENKGIYIKPNFKLKELINPLHSFTNITKHLYEAEGGVKPLNEFEKKVILKIAELSNVEFWHRNLEKSQGFYLNTFINHYPDFIVKLTNGELFLIETKGGHLENSPDTVSKLQSGETWQNGAGKDNYRYYMIFDKEPTQSHDCAASLNRILEIIKSR